MTRLSPAAVLVGVLLAVAGGIGGCGLGGTPRVDPGDVRAAAMRMEVALDRAADAHGRGAVEEALEAWREAHRAWDEQVGPGLEAQVGAQEAVALELHLARIRAALAEPDSDVAARVQAFDEALDSPLKSLPPAPARGDAAGP